VRADVFRKVGLLDGRYFINYDDADFGLRARAAGYRVVHCSSRQDGHKVSAAMGQASRQLLLYNSQYDAPFRFHAQGTARLQALLRVFARTLRTVGAWTIKPAYRRDALFHRRRDANLYAMRDFLLGRYGRMGPDVARACYG
jgi:GT2 family glycosyltransferase